jgi:hypothetical protein
MRVVEEPGAMSMKVSADGPNGVKTIHAAAATAADTIKKSASRIPAAPSPLFFRFPRVRRDAMESGTPFLKIRRGLSLRGFCFSFDCTGLLLALAGTEPLVAHGKVRF